MMKQNTFLKVMAIIMLVGGILGAIVSVIPAAISVLGALAGLDFIWLLALIIASVFAIVSSVLQIVAGAKGLGAAKDPAKAPTCVKLGIVIMALCVLSSTLTWIAPGGSFDVVSLLSGLVIPGLYTFSATRK
ncbi:MAG: hypothetical protein E7434_05905 [Ruminococcaceae bacterium]|nr:hypothetical protein [Oscillospiraceae bacterium]